MQKKRVAVLEPIHEDGLAVLSARDDVDLEVLEDADPARVAQVVSSAHGAIVRIARLPSEVLAPAAHLRVVSKHGVGCDNIDVGHLTARGLPVTVTAEANALSVAEHTLSLLLALAKQTLAYDAATRDGRFGERGRHRCFELSGKTALLVGFGRIGKRVARLFRAFDMRVIVADIALDRAAAREIGCEVAEDFRPCLAEADVLTLHVPLTDLTRNLVGTGELNALKHQAVVLNCARGGIVDETALAAALDSGHLAGAGLDVFAEEPPPPDHPLLGRPNVVLSPHTAAATEESMRRMAIAAAENVLAAFDGTLAPGNVFNRDDLQIR